MLLIKQVAISTLFIWLLACNRQHPPVSKPAGSTAAVQALNDTAFTWYQINPDSVFVYADSAYKMASLLQDTAGRMAAATHLTEYYRRKGACDKGLSYALEAKAWYQQQNNQKAVADVLVQIALLYKEMGDSDAAKDFLRKGLEQCSNAMSIYTALADTAGIANTLNAQGITYRDLAFRPGSLHFYDTAFNCYMNALKLITVSGKGTPYLGKLYNNISQIYTEYKKDAATGLQWLQKATAFNKAQNYQMGLSHNYGNLSEVYLKMGQHDSALYYAKSMEMLCRNMKAPHRLLNACKQLYKVYKADKQYELALSSLEETDSLTYESMNLGKSQQMAEMQIRFEAKEKEASIALLSVKNASNRRSIMWLAALLGVVLLLSGLLALLYRRQRKQKEQIEAQSQQLKMVMKELHHRVKNNLQIVSSLLSLQTYRIKDEQALAAMRESNQRVEAMSMIHQRLYKTDAITNVNIKEYLTDLAEYLVGAYGYNRDNFDLRVNVEQQLLDVDKALPLGLMVNELLTNAFKYAYKDIEQPSLYISLTTQGNQLSLTVQDNGRGMDMQRWQQQSGSFGKQLIQSLGKQLRAQQQVIVDGGTRFTFVIPMAA